MSDNDDVGYGRPPKKHQFKKGRSGNPNGRPKGAKSTRTLIKEELDRLIEITENGRVTRITTRQGLIRSQVAKAAKGSLQHFSYLVENEGEGEAQLTPRYDPPPGWPEPEPDGRIVIRLVDENPEITARIKAMNEERARLAAGEDLNRGGVGARTGNSTPKQQDT